VTRRALHTLTWLCAIALTACGQSPSDPASAAPSYDGKNRAVSFDGANDYAITGSAGFPLSQGTHTITFWVRPALIVGADAAASGDDRQAVLSLRKDFESGVVVGLRRGAFEAWSVYSARSYARAAAPATAGIWQHVAYTYDGTTHRLYVDGKLADETRAEVNHRTSTTGWLGSLDGSRNLFVGELDLVAVYTVALQGSTVTAQYARGRTTRMPAESALALVLWLGFDEVSGSKALDGSEMHNDALLGDGIPERMPERLLEP